MSELAKVMITFCKVLGRLLYQLTVGLTVVLVTAGLYWLGFLAIFCAALCCTVLLTLHIYEATDQHLGWTACGAVLASSLTVAVMILLRYLTKDSLGRAPPSLKQTLRLMTEQHSRSTVSKGDDNRPGTQGQGERRGGDKAVNQRQRLTQGDR